MKDLQDLQVLLGNQAFQSATFSKEIQAQLAFLGYQVIRGLRASPGLLDLRITQALQDQKVREVLLVPGVL